MQSHSTLHFELSSAHQYISKYLQFINTNVVPDEGRTKKDKYEQGGIKGSRMFEFYNDEVQITFLQHFTCSDLITSHFIQQEETRIRDNLSFR